MPGLAENVGVRRTDRRGARLTRQYLDLLQRGIVRGARNRGSEDPDGWQRSIVGIRNVEPRGQGTRIHRLPPHKCHGVNTFIPAVAAMSRYWGQGQQTTARPTSGFALNASQSEICSNSWRLGELAGVAAKSWMSTR